VGKSLYCIDCKKEFISLGYLGKRCPICIKKAIKKAREKHDRAHRRCHKKRAERLGVYYEPVDPIKVFIRDGFRCQLCGKKLIREDRGTRKDIAPELDHIITWAEGGEHSYKNTQCACRKCNRIKRVNSKGQLRIFG